jgi:hypothetical protein
MYHRIPWLQRVVAVASNQRISTQSHIIEDVATDYTIGRPSRI